MSCSVFCPLGAYKYYNTKTCLSCDASCSGCELNAYDCINCQPNYFRVIGSSACVADCGAGFYVLDGLCKQCPTGCALCSYTTQLVCTRCLSHGIVYYLDQNLNICVSNCPSRKFGKVSATNQLLC